VFKKPLRVKCRVIQHHIRDRSQAILFPREGDGLLDLLDASVRRIGLLQDRLVILELLKDTVRAARSTPLLERSPMQHVVTPSTGLVEVLLPLVGLPHPFGEHREDDEPIQRQLSAFRQDCSGRLVFQKTGRRGLTGREEGGSGGQTDDGVDVEVTFTANNAR
jgi:hypothetical protein